jgi:hypothetical protein
MEVRQSTRVGVLIVVVSILGAGVTWRAAGVSGTGSDLDQRARQALIQLAQVRAEHDAVIAFEERLFAAYRDHHALADALERDDQDAGARRERAAARALDLLFFAGGPYDSEGRLRYQREEARRFFNESDDRLVELQPRQLEAAAAAARRKRLWLVGVDTVLIASIFFSTLALLWANRMRRLGLAGLGLGAAGAVAFVVVELGITVPAL